MGLGSQPGALLPPPALTCSPTPAREEGKAAFCHKAVYLQGWVASEAEVLANAKGLKAGGEGDNRG